MAFQNVCNDRLADWLYSVECRISKIMSNMQSHATSNPNTIAQYAAIAALDGPTDTVEMMRSAFLERRNYMVERINKIDGVSCLCPHGAFYVMMNISQLMGKTIAGCDIGGSDDFANAFLEKANVAVVPAADSALTSTYAGRTRQVWKT